MANKFLTTNIVDPVKAPITKRSLEHINSMSALVGDAIVKGLLSSYTTDDLIVLQGCVVSVTSGSIPGTGTATLTAGYVYRNGEIFAVDANASLSTTNPQTLVWVADDQDLAGDPATFSDGNTYDFHRVAKLKLQAGTAGSGLNNYNAATVKYLYTEINGPWIDITPVNSWAVRDGILRYRKDVSGKVTIFGAIDAPGTFTSFFTLPVGYRPVIDQALPILIQDAGNVDAGVIYINTSGVCLLAGTDPYGSTLSNSAFVTLFTEFYTS